MKKKIEMKIIPCMYRGSFSFIWEDNFSIYIYQPKENLIIQANEDGLISLARHLITLIDAPNYAHFHLDEFNSLEDGSCEVIFQKNNLSNQIIKSKNNIDTTELKEEAVQVVIEIEYEKNIKINSEEECYIGIYKQGDAFLLEANEKGLLVLAKYFLILAQVEFLNNDFICINKNNLLSEKSYGLVIEKLEETFKK